MSDNRWMRDFRLVITPNVGGFLMTTGLIPGTSLVINPPLRVGFDVHKSIYGGLNKASIRVYNLAEAHYKQLYKEKQSSVQIPFTLEAGYVGNRNSIFQGTLWTGKTGREDTDIVTQLEGMAGYYDFVTANSNQVAQADPIRSALKDTAMTSVGHVPAEEPHERPVVLIGNTYQCIDELINKERGDTWYVENDKLYVLKKHEAVSLTAPVVSPDTGLISTPTREQFRVTFVTLMNPAIQLGGLVSLQSKLAQNLNGKYRVDTIDYRGDNFGQKWEMECTCMAGDFVQAGA